jgi:hypothetical protein
MDPDAEFERLREVVRRAGLEPFELTAMERVIDELEADMRFWKALGELVESPYFPKAGL